MNGKLVEPHTVNILLLSGITNILCQSEVVDDTLERMKVLEVENLTNKTRLEFLESWILKLSDEEKEVREKIVKLEEDLNSKHVIFSMSHPDTRYRSKEISTSTPQRIPLPDWLNFIWKVK